VSGERTTGTSSPWLVVVIVCVAQFMVVLDATIVNVALPSIQRGLRFSPSSLQWVINMYTLIFGGFILLGGRAGDLIGRKRVFGAGIVPFSGASLLNGLAQSSGMLIAGRGCKGLGARCSRRWSSRSSRRLSATRRIARRRWRSGARSPPAVAPWGCCWAGC
jgi:MFS family permease